MPACTSTIAKSEPPVTPFLLPPSPPSLHQRFIKAFPSENRLHFGGLLKLLIFSTLRVKGIYSRRQNVPSVWGKHFEVFVVWATCAGKMCLSSSQASYSAHIPSVMWQWTTLLNPFPLQETHSFWRKGEKPMQMETYCRLPTLLAHFSSPLMELKGHCFPYQHLFKCCCLVS